MNTSCHSIKIDFTTTACGSIVLFNPHNDETRDHLKRRCPDAQWLGGSLACETRFAGALVEALSEEGFTSPFSMPSEPEVEQPASAPSPEARRAEISIRRLYGTVQIRDDKGALSLAGQSDQSIDDVLAQHEERLIAEIDQREKRLFRIQAARTQISRESEKETVK